MTPEEIRNKQKNARNEVIIFWACSWLALGILFVLQKYVLGGQFIGNIIFETPKLYCLFIWIGFILTSSIFEAFYFTHEINSGFIDNFNEHPLLVFIRAWVLIPLWILTSWDVALCYAVIFPFFHDGQYYRWRDKIVPGTYKKRWFDQSTTSTARSTKFMTPSVRIMLAVSALVTLYFI